MRKTKRKICDPCNETCYSTTHKCPIIVAVSKDPCKINDDGNRCGKPCHVHISGITRFPNISTEPPKRTYRTECDQCLEVIRERDRLLYDKDVEMLQLITDFITLPKNKDDGEKEAIKTHNFKALRELEHKLMQKEKEIAKMKMRECEEFCYNVMREKQLELRWKDFELEKLERRPNVIFRSIKKLTTRNRKHCFTKLQKRERKLLEREKEIDEALEELRERKYNEEMAYLEEELEERLKPIVIDTEIECSCECAKYNKIIEEELERQKKMSHDACAYFPIGGYIPFWTCDTMELLKKTAFCEQDFTK